VIYTIVQSRIAETVDPRPVRDVVDGVARCGLEILQIYGFGSFCA
jgi:hypothetical protein